MAQYTIRQVPPALDRLLRTMAARRRMSMNALVTELLMASTGLQGEPVVHHDLDDLAGAWVKDPECDRVLESFEVIDEEMWK